MSMPRKYLVPLLFTLGLLLGAAPASAGGTTTTHETRRESFTFELTPAQCPSLLVTLYGSGETFQVINMTTYADGSQKIVDNAVKTGTAWDSTGSYHFRYHNHFVQDIPPSGAPIQAFMSDSFVLNGSGSAKHLKSGFVWRWTSNIPPGDNFPPNVASWQIIATIGEGIACDPI